MGKQALTFSIITTLFHTEKGGKNKRKRRQSKGKKVILPPTSSNKSLCSYLLSNGLSIEAYFMWQALLFCFFPFYFPLFSGTSGTNRGARAGPFSAVLNRCHLHITRHHPAFLCVDVCFLLTPSVLNHCLIPPPSGVGGEEGKQSSAFPAAAPRLWHRGSPRYPPRKLIQSIKNLESGAFLRVFVH